jgi:transcriptional regulator with XRE-family HTH domain
MGNYLAVEKLAALVKAKRGNKGLRELAKEIGGISPSTLSRIEQGKMPDLDTFIRLCNWLEVSPNQFFEGEPNSEAPQDKSRVPPVAPGMSTPQIIEVHLRADKELDPETAEALANMVKAAYKAIRAGKLGRKRAEAD